MKIKQLTALLLSLFSAIAFANVSMEMFQMQRQLGALNRAESVDEFTQRVDDFIQAAAAAREKMPASLDDDQERFGDYQKAMDDLIETAKQAKTLAEQGNLSEAKSVAERLNQQKKLGHSEYK